MSSRVRRARTVVRPVVSVAAVAVALLPICYVFPDGGVTVREVVLGALVAALGWTTLSGVFRYYVAASSTARTASSVSSSCSSAGSTSAG
jgi:uncharacterized BrkB/YihY/UPF0761 family membrane protein